MPKAIVLPLDDSGSRIIDLWKGLAVTVIVTIGTAHPVVVSIAPTFVSEVIRLNSYYNVGKMDSIPDGRARQLVSRVSLETICLRSMTMLVSNVAGTRDIQ